MPAPEKEESDFALPAKERQVRRIGHRRGCRLDIRELPLFGLCGCKQLLQHRPLLRIFLRGYLVVERLDLVRQVRLRSFERLSVQHI